MSAAHAGDGRSSAGERLQLKLAADIAAVEQSRDALVGCLERWSLERRLANRIEVVLEELVSNVARHGKPASFVRVTASHHAGEVVLVIEDDGPAFNPFERGEPERPVSPAKTQVGGFGLLLIKRLSRRHDYLRSEGINRTEVVFGPS